MSRMDVDKKAFHNQLIVAALTGFCSQGGMTIVPNADSVAQDCLKVADAVLAVMEKDDATRDCSLLGYLRKRRSWVRETDEFDH